MNSPKLPAWCSQTSHSLFASYSHLWDTKEAVCDKMGRPYWEVALASVRVIMEEAVRQDQETILNKWQNQH